MFQLDYSKAVHLQLSNDAFHYLLYGEECLDDLNLDEAQEIQNMFPHGFWIEDDWQPIEGTDMIEATFVPYEDRAQQVDYDLVMDLSAALQLRLTWLNTEKTKARVIRYYPGSGHSELYGDFDIWETKPGHKCFNKGDWKNGNGCLFFLKRFHSPDIRSNR